MTRLLAGRPKNRGSIFGTKNPGFFFFYKELNPALGPTHPPYAMDAVGGKTPTNDIQQALQSSTLLVA